MHLGGAFDRAGLPVRCPIGGPTVSFRMYLNGLRQLMEGWTKNLSGGAARVRPIALVLAIWWVASGSAAVGGVDWVIRSATGRPAGWLPPLLFVLVAAQNDTVRQVDGFVVTEAGASFEGGVSKGHLGRRGDPALLRFAIETRRGEVAQAHRARNAT